MLPNLPKRARMLEFVWVVVLISTLGAILLRTLAELQQESERLAVDLTIRNMNSGLKILQSQLVVSGRESGLRELATQNPVSWLEAPPEGYIGEQHCPGVIASGQWCWEVHEKTLYYYPKQENWVKVPRNMPWLTWRVVGPGADVSFRPGSIRLQVVGAITPHAH